MSVSTQLQDAQVTIVGLGLMGGSLAAALTTRGACRRVVGVARHQDTITQVLAMGIIHEGTCQVYEGVKDANIVVLATPVLTYVITPLERTSDTAIALAQELVRIIGAQPLVLDHLRHDVLVVAVSHLPYLLAVTLVAVGETLADNAIWQLAPAVSAIPCA